jgi:hypothetical protein
MTSLDPSLVSALTGSGNYVKFEEVGQVGKVKITGLARRQVNDFKTQKPAFWDDGNPKEQIQFLGTDPDTGEEISLYVKTWGNQWTAVREAFKASGSEPEIGGVLALQWTGSEDEPATVGLSPAKTWVAQYKPPTAPQVGIGDLL